jgi:[ribosomal protein S5]-alanine N-acetyltransferase
MIVPGDSERLQFREVLPDDAPLFLELMNQPDYIRFIGDRNITDIDRALAYIEEKQRPSYQLNGFGSYVIERKSDGQELGFCGIYRRDGFDIPDLGYAFLGEYHGYGYANEAATAVLSHAENQLGLKQLCAIVSPGNDRSINLLKKIGFTWDKSGTFPQTDDPIELYSWKA